MGLRESSPETGKFPGAKNRSFNDRCASFFIRQLNVWKPAVILTLGVHAMQAVGETCKLDTPTTIQDCDRIYDACLGYGAVTIVSLTHPSYYPVNVRRRRYRNLTGPEAEQAMIADAMAIRGFRF
jgi:uracil-DNA glycosylase